METTKSKIEELREKHEKELRELEAKERIREALPDIGFEWSIHVHSLYGSVGSVCIKQPWGYNESAPTLDTFLAMAEALPGLPMVKVKGTYTSYLAKAQLPAYEEGGRTKIDSEEDIAPWIVEGDGHGRCGSRCTVEWVTDLPGIGMVRVEFELPFNQHLRYAATRVEYRGGFSWKDEQIVVNRNKLYNIFGKDGDSLAELGPSTRWGSGGREYSCKCTQAWTPLDDPCEATVADFARALIKANEKV